MNRQKDTHALYSLSLSMLVFGTIGLFRRHIALPCGVIAAARGLTGVSFLLLLMHCTGKAGTFRSIHPLQLLLLTLTGGLIGFNWILLFEAYNYTSIATATLCYYMQPVIVIMLSPLFFHEPLRLRKLVCVAAALLGMVFVSGVPEQGIPAAGELRGILCGLGAACLYASVVLLNKHILGIDPYAKTTVQLLAAAVVLLPYLCLTGAFGGIRPDLLSIGMLLFVGIFHTGFCYMLYFGAIERLPAQTSALLSYIDPVTAILLSALFLHERMTPLGILGTVLVLGSTVAGELLP